MRTHLGFQFSSSRENFQFSSFKLPLFSILLKTWKLPDWTRNLIDDEQNWFTNETSPNTPADNFSSNSTRYHCWIRYNFHTAQFSSFWEFESYFDCPKSVDSFFLSSSHNIFWLTLSHESERKCGHFCSSKNSTGMLRHILARH